MIVAKNLIKDFGKRRAVDNVSFEVKKGTVLGFLGPNGAGKTTTLRMIAGFFAPTSGSVTVKGIDVASDPVAAQKNMGYMPETTPLYGDMNVYSFLRFIAEIRGFSGADRNKRVDYALDRCFLQSVKNQTIDTLSKGYRQRTCLAQALLHDPDILLLDEPTEGLDPNQKQVVRNMIQDMAAEHVVMISTHVLEEVEAICTRAIIINNGRIVVDDTPDKLKKRSAQYNVVTFKAEGKKIIPVLENMPTIKTVDTLEDGSIVAFPNIGESIVTDIFDAAQKHKWKITDIKVNDGQLDDVFRQMTIAEDINKKDVA